MDAAPSVPELPFLLAGNALGLALDSIGSEFNDFSYAAAVTR
jgi:hypothetical protein